MGHRKAQREPLCIHVLGPPAFEWAHQPLALGRRQVRALLCYLAVSGPAPRERLCGLFWPDCPEALARRKLTHLLTHLQRALPPGNWLTTEDDRLSLASSRIWVDVLAFAASLPPHSSPRAEAEERLAPESVRRIEASLDLYRGDFLAGFSLPESPEFDLWVCTERERWRREYLSALALLVRGCAAAGDATRAITFAQRYLAVDDLAEEMHRRLIELYAAVGQRAAALRQYETCVATLERELGVNPLPETAAAYQAALQGAAPLHLRPPTALPAAPLDAPLTGRAEALELLDAAWNEVLSGHGRMVFLTGEAGIGKTRLAHEFAAACARAAGPGPAARVLIGSAQASESKTPYFPLLAALRGSLAASDWQAWSPHLDDVWLAECARVLPEIRLHHRAARPAPVLEPRYSRAQLFEALTRLLLGLAADRPLVLFLDDLHWADDTTLAWLGTVARRMGNERVFLLLAYRSDAVTPDLLSLRELSGRLGLSLVLPLQRLSVEHVTALVRELAGPAEVLGFSQRLYEETDGNPFFVVETLRGLLERAHAQPRDPHRETDWAQVTRDYQSAPLPESIRALLAARLRALSPAARQLVDVAAVLGPVFEHALLWRASGRSEAEVVEALDELLARQIIQEQAPSTYAFTHDKLHEQAYRELSAARRRLLHRRAGEALSGLNPGAAVALSRHFEQAQDDLRAAHYALSAGQAAQAVFAHSEARTHFERALQLLESAGRATGDPAARTTLQRLQIAALDGRGWVLRLLGEMDAYARDLDRVAELARALEDRQLQARASWRQAYAALWFCRYEQVERAGTAGIALARAMQDPEMEMECVWTMALAARGRGDYARARRGLLRAWKYFAAHGSPVAQVHLLSGLSTLNLQEKRYAAAERAARQALALCDQGPLPYHRRLPLGDLGALAIERGECEPARRYLVESLSIARQIADRTQEIFCLGNLGWLCLRLNEAKQAHEYFAGALQVAQAVGSRAEQSGLLAGLAETHFCEGNWAQARAAAQSALESAETLAQKRDHAVARELLARLSQASGTAA